MKRALICIFVLILIFLFSVGVFAVGSVPSKVLSATSSVVRILAEHSDGYGMGSGFVIKSDSESTLIATNYHVVEGEPFGISVWIDDEETINAKILAYTDQKDLCILKLAYPIPLETVRFADSVAQGDAVYAVGFPAAADYLSDSEAHTSAAATITDGIISAIREVTVSNHGVAIKMLQINAAINSGNSGGPLFNAYGEVVGINTYGIIESQGIFGAIDISELEAFLKDNGINIESEDAGHKVLTVIVIAVILAAVCVTGVVILLRRTKPKHKKGKDVSLRAFMENKPQGIGENEAVALLLPIAIKLRDMHNNGESHLQLSPDSVFVSSKGARLRDPSDSEVARYTSGYASPEVYKGKPAGHLSDIYSFCALLSYASSGKHPENSLSRTVGNETPESDFDTIVKNGMAMAASERIGTMQELIYKISPFNIKVYFPAAGHLESPQTTDDETEEKSKKKRFKAPKRTVIIAIIVVAIAACAGAYLLGYSKASSCANVGEYKAAEKWLFAAGVTKIHDPQLVAYLDAHALLAERKYDEAKAEFSNLGEYKDSVQMVNEANYRYAAQCADGNKFDEAIVLFASLAEVEYKDSAEKVYETRYRQGAYILYELKDYESAREIFKALRKEGYESADEMLNEVDYWWAWSYIESEEYVEAYRKLKTIKDYLDSSEIMDELTEYIYNEGQTLYRSGNYAQAESRFYCVKDYSRSEDYLILIALRRYGDTDVSAEKLLGLFYFEDTADLLLKYSDIAVEVLLGEWRSSDGRYYFEVYTKEEIRSYLQGIKSAGLYTAVRYYTRDNLPGYSGVDYYEISDGTYYVTGSSYNKKPQFKFTMTAPDCMDVYCYKDGSTYTLYRN